jgi:hypothetical protein
MWLTGGRTLPTFGYRLVSSEPLVLADDVRWFASDGAEKHIRGVDRWKGDDFVWRGSGLLTVLRSRWAVLGSSEDGNVLVTRFSKTIATPSGLDVISRDGIKVEDPRALVARSVERFGLTAEQFASLAWPAPS